MTESTEILTKHLILMRGLPSAGKSYRAAELVKLVKTVEGGLILSTDEFWYKMNKPDLPEEYSFNPRYLGEAHYWNQQRAMRKIEVGHPLLVIDNTNTTLNEMIPYAQHAHWQDYEVSIEEPTSEWWLKLRPLLRDKKNNKDELREIAGELAKRSEATHRVPQWSIEKMMWRWEEFSVEDLLNHIDNPRNST